MLFEFLLNSELKLLNQCLNNTAQNSSFGGLKRKFKRVSVTFLFNLGLCTVVYNGRFVPVEL